jgi:hypothetical protein
MDGPRLATTTSGRALVAWNALERDATRFVRSRGVFAAVWSEPGGWGPLSQVSVPDVEAFLIDVALDPVGGGAVFWFKRNDTQLQLWVSRLSADGAWLPAELVPNAKALSAAAFLPNGDLLVIWADGPAVLASRRRGASWSEPETLQDGSLDPQRLIGRVSLAANDRGEALAAWASHQIWTSRLRVP